MINFSKFFYAILRFYQCFFNLYKIKSARIIGVHTHKPSLVHNDTARQQTELYSGQANLFSQAGPFG